MSNDVETQIKDAITRSLSHNEIVSLTIHGDSSEAMDAINEAWDEEWEYAMSDYEGEDRMDAWGWTSLTPANEQDWRLDIKFLADSLPES